MEKYTKLTHEDFIQIMNQVDNSLEILEEYKNTTQKIKTKCQVCGNIWFPASRDLLRGRGCRKCKMAKSNAKISHNKMLKSKETFLERLEKVNLCYKNKEFEIIGEYNGFHKSIICKCNKHNYYWETTPQELIKGSSCPKCYGSNMEKLVSNFLDNNNIEYFREYKFIDCKDKKKLPFDFYLPKYNCCIETDGEQHFKSVNHFGGEDNFKLILKHDEIKNNYCKENNIYLLRISYNDIQNIENILNKLIKNIE